ncbi:MAG: Maf family protein [Planctomycetes bacterium]|nr:Maf family protein [Planctomycetota bacterium]
MVPDIGERPVITQFVLGSRSPRRRDLLSLIVPVEHILVRPPRDPAELEFDGLTSAVAIEARLIEIAQAKFADVQDQLSEARPESNQSRRCVVIAADTTIVVPQRDGSLHVIGQPPADDSWKTVVRGWFQAQFAGRTHAAVTSLHVGIVGGPVVRRLVRTEVEFIADVDRYLEWYLNTGEPIGKAGGYALQGAGSVFISKVTGSLSNVIGLPLEALWDCFSELQIDVARNR